MVPYIFAMRMMARANANPTPSKTMTCKTPCKNCTCDTVYSSDYVEIDPSPMATQQSRYLADLKAVQAKASYWDVFCTTDPSAPECKVHDN